MAPMTDTTTRHSRYSRFIRSSPVAAAVLLAAPPAAAHGFGQRYDLPVPLSLYLGGAAAAIVFSFVLIALFARGAPAKTEYPLARRGVPSRVAIAAGQVVASGLTALVLMVGWLGSQNPLMNLAPTAVWVIWWVGLIYISALFGNLWAWVNPWAASFGWAEALWRRATGRGLSLGLAYPAALGVWPGLALLAGFVWVELVFPHSAVPAAIAGLGFAYSLLTWAGMAAFGRETWLAHGEAFALAFGVFARYPPFRSQSLDEPATPSMVALVLFLLSSVMFDGALSTPAWALLENWLAVLLPGSDAASRMAARTLGLIAVWLAFLGAYLGTCWAMAQVAGGPAAMGTLARRFAFSLVPIAIAYHVAHYLSFLLIQGQYLIPLASDPLGRGWNLLGTAGYRVNIAVIGARFEWYAAVSAIVLGHVTAVWLAHRTGQPTIAVRQRALASLYLMTGLMVAYTVVSLSILAAPVVEADRPGLSLAETPPDRVPVPADTVLPKTGSGRLLAVGPGKAARLGVTFRVLGSAFHDGTRVTAADLLYPYVIAWRWGSERDGVEYDPAIARATALARASLLGLRVEASDTVSRSIRFGDVTVSHELLVIDAYFDLATGDLDRLAAVAPPWDAVPWTVLALMEETVRRGWAAFSQEEAARRGVPWLDLVRSPELAQRMAGLIDAFTRDGFRPVGLESLVTVEEARQRWAALAAFYREHGHFLVTNGPYRLKGWSPGVVTLEAFRDLSYPLGVGSFDALATPRRAFITKVEPEAAGLHLVVEVERVQKFQRSYRIVRGPLAGAPVIGPAEPPPLCRYLVLARDSEVVLAGEGRLEEGSFHLDLTGRLAPGDYSVEAAVYVGGNAMNPEIARIPYRVGP